MSRKIPKTYTLSESGIEYIETFANENGLSKTAALERIIEEHKNGTASATEAITSAVIDGLEEKYKNMFTRIRLASTMADRHMEVLLEVMNTLLFKMNVTTGILTTQSKNLALQECEDEIKKRIESRKQKKDSRST